MDPSARRLEVHSRLSVAGFDYLIVGRGTALVRYTTEHVRAAAFRNLLASSELEEQRTGITLVQSLWYMPSLRVLDHPLDIGFAAVSYLQRHPRVQSALVVAPELGLVRLVLDVIVRAIPGFNARMMHLPEEVGKAPFLAEPSLPKAWHEWALYERSP